MSEDVSRVPGTVVFARGANRAAAAGTAVGGLAGLAVGLVIAAVFDVFGGWAVTIVTVAAGAVAGGWVQSRLGSRDLASSPLTSGQLGYLAVLPEVVVLFAAKAGVSKPKRTDSVLASMPRSSTTAARLLKRNELEIAFADGSSWTFGIRRSKRVDEIISALAPAQARLPDAPAGWYPDPHGRFELRYWDGSAWTPHVSRDGVAHDDPQ